MKHRIWPGNQCDCQDPENVLVHDYLCDILEKEMKYSENDVCIASVGMWGAIHLMREKLNLARREIEMLEVSNITLKEENSRLSDVINKLDHELQTKNNTLKPLREAD